MSGALPIPSKQFKVLKGHEGPVLCTRFNSNGTYVLTGGQDCTPAALTALTAPARRSRPQFQAVESP